MNDSQLPPGSSLRLDFTGAAIIDTGMETSDIFLPSHNESISHIALDVSAARTRTELR